MPSRRGKYHYKVDQLRGYLSAQDRTAFDSLCQFNPTYASIQSWFAERGYKISVNAIHHWWCASYPDRDEIKIMNGLVAHLDVKDFHRLHASALKLAIIATNILDAHINGKLASADPSFLAERQRELCTRALELTRLQRTTTYR
jgi:hypothetical protein